MQDEARSVLSQLIESYGTDLVDDHRRLRSMLADKLPSARREAQRLVLAAEEGIPRRILTAGGDASGALRMQLARSLQDERDMTPEAADWAVDSWAAALGVDLGGPLPITSSDKTRTVSRMTDDDQPPLRTPVPISWLVGGGGVAVAAILLLVLGPLSGFIGAGNSSSPTPSAELTGELTPPPSASTGPESPEPTPTATASPRPTPTPAPTPVPLQAQLEEWIPDAVVATCFKLDLSRKEWGPYRYAMSCDTPKASFVFYLLYRDRADLQTGYERAAASTLDGRRDFGNCPSDIPSEAGWVFTGEDRVRGRLACDAVASYAWLYWTMPYANVLGYMQRPDDNIVRLVSAWRDLGTVRP